MAHKSATTKLSERNLDFYPTPTWAIEILLTKVPIRHCSVLEPCAGNGALLQPLRNVGCRLTVSDIDPTLGWPTFDAQNDDAYLCKPDWVVTNPPFSSAFKIIQKSHEHAKYGIAMLLRLSFLEPTYTRGPWLSNNPPSGIIVLPRISFSGDGKTDNVTCAWMFWEKRFTQNGAIRVIPRN